MKENTSTQEVFIIEDGVEVPESALRRAEDEPYYGSVPGLNDDELASPAELEHQAFVADWGPILDLPCQGSNGMVRPTIDELGNRDWGAFGTWDFEMIRGAFDKARYKADRLRERLRTDLIMLDVVRERVNPGDRARVRRLALDSQFDLDDIDDPNEWSYARWIRRIRRLSDEIRAIGMCRRRRIEQLGSWRSDGHSGGYDSEVEA